MTVENAVKVTSPSNPSNLQFRGSGSVPELFPELFAVGCDAAAGGGGWGAVSAVGEGGVTRVGSGETSIP